MLSVYHVGASCITLSLKSVNNPNYQFNYPKSYHIYEKNYFFCFGIVRRYGGIGPIGQG